MNLQQVDRNQLYACKSDADWARAITAIKARHGGFLPGDWHTLMVTGGLEESLRSQWPKPKSAGLVVDPARIEHEDATGIAVRSQLDGKWGRHDMATLDKASLLEFLRSRGGNNPFAEDVCGILLGHGHLHDHDSSRSGD